MMATITALLAVITLMAVGLTILVALVKMSETSIYE